MTKEEVLKYCDEKSLEGYLTHKMILEIYDDGEEVPDDIVDLICYIPTPPKEIIFFMGAKLQEEFDISLAHYWLSMTINDKIISQ
jgi:hypothetical protein